MRDIRLNCNSHRPISHHGIVWRWGDLHSGTGGTTRRGWLPDSSQMAFGERHRTWRNWNATRVQTTFVEPTDTNCVDCRKCLDLHSIPVLVKRFLIWMVCQHLLGIQICSVIRLAQRDGRFWMFFCFAVRKGVPNPCYSEGFRDWFHSYIFWIHATLEDDTFLRVYAAIGSRSKQ